MAKDKITQKDVIDDSVIKSISVLNKELQESVKLMSELSKTAIDLNKNFDPKNINDVTSSVESYNKVNQESQQINKDAASTLEKLQDKIKQLNEEEERAKVALAEKRKEIRDKIKAEKESKKSGENLIALLKKQARTEKEAAEQNKKLIALRKQMDVTTKKGAKTVSQINKVIDKNNDLLKENASTFGKQKMNVGNYTDSIKEALGNQEFFGVSINKVGSALKSGAGIIGAVSAVVVGLGRAYASSARGAEDLARASDRLRSIGSSLGNMFADAAGDVGFFDGLLRSLQQQILGLASTIESDLVVGIKSQIRELAILETEQERQKKSLLDAAEVQRQIRDDERNSFEKRKAANEELGRIINERESETVAFQEKILGNLQTLLKFDEGNLEIQQQIKQIEFEIADAREEAQGFRSEMLTNDMALSKEFAANEIELQKTILEGKLATVIEGSAEEIRLKQELINKTKELELQAAGDNEQLQQIAIQKAKNLTDELYRFKLDSKITENESFNELFEEQSEKELELLEEKLDAENELLIEKLEELNEMRAEKYQEDTDNQKASDEEKKASVQSYISFATSQAQRLSDSIIGFVSQELANQQMADIEKAKSKGASEAEIEKIEKEYAQKRKNLALTQAIINTALGVTNALNTQPFMPLGLIMAVLAAAMGAVEIATIASASFYKGTPDSGSQWLDATVGEKGVERINLADGRSFYTPNGPTKMLLPPHSEVVPNHRLQQELAEMQSYGSKRNQHQESQLSKEQHKELINTIKNKKETHLNITENGVSVTAKKGNNFYKYIDRKYRD